MRIDQLPVASSITNNDTLPVNVDGSSKQVSIGNLTNSIRDNVYGAPLTAATSAAMTDQTRVYVYTGTTSGGFTNGHWYYYNGSAWTDGGAYNSSAVTTDTTLTLSGVPADAKATGEKLTDLRSAITRVEQPYEHELASNLADPAKTVAGEMVNQTTGIFTSNANHTRTGLIEVEASATYSIALKDDSVEYIRYAFYNSSKEYISGGLVSVSTDLHYLITTTSATMYIAISAPNAYFPICLIKSTVRVMYRAWGVVVDTLKKSFLPTISPNNTDFFIIPDNLVDPSDVVTGEYVNQFNGNFASNSAHNRTDYIPVTEGEKYCIAFKSNLQTITIRYAWYNSEKSYRTGDMVTIGSFDGVLTVPSNAAYLVVSAPASHFPLMIQQSNELIDYIEYGATTPIFPEKYLVDNSTSDVFYQQYKGDAQSYTLGVTNSIKKNKIINFGCDFSSFGSLTLSLTSADGIVQNKFVIDGTNLTRTVNGSERPAEAHGLTIADHINVTIEITKTGIIISVVSSGERYSSTYEYSNGRIVPSFSVASMTVSNVDFSWTCTDFHKRIWCFGDSYFSYGTNRWIYYLFEDGYADNCLIDAYAGENSESSMDSLLSYITLAIPETIVWCLGMNDGTDTGDTPSVMWSTAITNLINTCNTFGIKVILATVPTIPSINHEAKNAWVRASGYQYIDFAKAVGADSNGNWFTGMLSQDGVHPTVAGAMALYRQAITDCPQLMID